MKKLSLLLTMGLVSLSFMGCASTQTPPGTPPAPSQTNEPALTEDQSAPLEVNGQDVEYYSGVKGFFAEPVQEGNYPGVVMIHEWWGLNDNIKTMAKTLAQEGYMVLAVDLYHGEVAETSDRAGELAGSLNQEEATKNMQAAEQYLRDHGAHKIASLGWCFGGGQSLQLALSGEKLDATVIYYGQLVTDSNQLKKITWPVLGIFGDQDTTIPVEKVMEFDKALSQLNIESYINIYPDVGHAFANPSNADYSPEATENAWGKTTRFLDRTLKGSTVPVNL